jgi:hypothetical protein
MLAGMAISGHKQGDLAALILADKTGGIDPLAGAFRVLIFYKQGLSRVIKNTKSFEVILEHLILHPRDSVFRLSANPIHD